MKVCTVVDDEGVLLGCVHILRNVTEHKYAVDALRVSEKHFRLLVETAPDAIVIFSSNRIVYVNPAALRMFGADSAARLIGQSVMERVHRDSRKFLIECIRLMATGGRSIPTTELKCLRLDGSALDVEASAIPYLYRGDSAVLVFARDITGRRKMEALQELLKTAIDQLAETVVITDAEGTIQYVNPAFEATTGYSNAEAIGQNPRILKSGLQDGAFYENMWRTISAGMTWSGRIVNRRKDGTHYTEEATISPVLDKAGKVSNYVAVKHDVSRVMALEAQFLQAQKMEGIGRLAGGIAHDFNNLLSVILGYTDLALQGLDEADGLARNLRQIDKAAARAAALTNQLLAFSRKQIIQPEVLDLNSVITDLDQMLHRVIGEDVDMILRLSPWLKRVFVDRSQLDQVILNLVVNARDAMPQGGRIVIETANADLDDAFASMFPGMKPGSYVMFSITDTGCGMDRVTKDRIFEPFFTTKGAGKGTGLGLSTVYGIVKQNNGYVAVDSEIGRGTTFRIYLPSSEASAAELSAHSEKKTRSMTGRETILVADDDAAVRDLVVQMLQAAGYTVVAAPSGHDALAASERHQAAIDLLLTDVIMPGMSGKALAEEMSRRRPALRVMYMSGYSNENVADEGVLDKDVNLLNKPFRPAELLKRVRSALESEPTAVQATGKETQGDADDADGRADHIGRLDVPSDVLAELRKAVLAARYDDIMTINERIRRMKPATARVIDSLARVFDYDGIMNLLDKEVGS